MAIRGIIKTITPTTTLADAWTVPAGKEWVARTIRATNKSGADTTATVTIAGGNVAFNAPVRVGQAVNVFGPDSAILPAGTVIQTRGGSGGALDIVGFFDERDVV